MTKGRYLEDVDIRLLEAKRDVYVTGLAAARVDEIHKTALLSIPQREGLILAQKVLAELDAEAVEARDSAIDATQQIRETSEFDNMIQLLRALSSSDSEIYGSGTCPFYNDREKVAGWIQSRLAMYGVSLR